MLIAGPSGIARSQKRKTDRAARWALAVWRRTASMHWKQGRADQQGPRKRAAACPVIERGASHWPSRRRRPRQASKGSQTSGRLPPASGPGFEATGWLVMISSRLVPLLDATVSLDISAKLYLSPD